MTEADLGGVDRLARRVHPGFFEAPAVFADRFRLCPEGCLVLGEGGDLAGYAVAHPARLFEPPPLNTVLARLPAGADALHIHDVAVSPERRGRGAAAPGIRRLLELADGFAAAQLVSVDGTAPFWSGFGFRPETDPRLGGALAPYGPDAVFMVRRTTGLPKIRPDGEMGGKG